MKIRSIELTNLRRFAGKSARITGIGDGITVLSEPNEFGKSTFFDALHALFFERHRGTKQAVKALQPHSGGAPEVAVEIDLPEGRFRIEKRWLSRATARVSDGQGRIVAQDDEAEAWIDRLLGKGLHGPSGLLWVRQGLLGLEPEGASASDRNDRERALGARRDLLSSVAGEIELMTGGRRLDAVLARLNDEIARLATSTLRPKAGGEWARASDELKELQEEETTLAAKAAQLSGELSRRAELQRQIQRLDDPEEAQRRVAALNEAETAQQAAHSHAEKLTEAQQALNLARLTTERSEAEILRLETLSERLLAADAAATQAEQKSMAAVARAAELRAADQEAAAALNAARDATRALRGRLDLAQRARLAEAAHQRAGQLRRTLIRGEELRHEIEADQARRSLIRVTDAALQRAETADADLRAAMARIEARSASLTIRYDGASRVRDDAGDLAEGSHRLTAARDFHLPGIGDLRIEPGASDVEDLLTLRREAEARRDAALLECGADSVPAARQLLGQAQALDLALKSARSILAELAPDGLEALRRSLTQAEAEAGGAGNEPIDDPAKVQAALDAASEIELGAQDRAAQAHTRAVAAGEARAAAGSSLSAAEQAAQAARAEAGDLDQLAARLLSLRRERLAQQARQAEAERMHAALAQVAPDLALVAAQLARAQSVVAQARTTREILREEASTLNGSIGALAEQGIEERLDELRGRREAAEAREARYAAELQSLVRLREALEAARKEARDAYFAPVLQELEPLLAVLHPGATLQIDDQSLLPVALTRGGQAEGLEILSGGTREQIAILTRLAFARLFARSGQAVPVILDDALVHADDDRIEAMFTALHRVARDQQIIVLTCRQRAFAALGGERAIARIEEV